MNVATKLERVKVLPGEAWLVFAKRKPELYKTVEGSMGLGPRAVLDCLSRDLASVLI